MPWIPHVMVLDDDPRVLESLLPTLAYDLGKAAARIPTAAQMLTRGESSAASPSAGLNVKVTAHGYPSERVASYRSRSPHQLHLHLVRETGGRFDLARRLLNEQLFSVVVSDLRFSDDVGGLRAGQLFIDELMRVHPEAQGLLYSAYPRPEGFPAERFLRKGPETTMPQLAEQLAKGLERHLADPAVNAFATAIADQQLIYQSEAFGTLLAQLFDLARLFGVESTSDIPKTVGRARRPLPCLLLDGESGTGKRGLAAVFHAATSRRKAPLAIASCSELTNETLLRSILFGHKRGAFTDAREDRAGLVAAAGRGLLLLDDFHRLPTACSAILHSFLEDGEFSRLGEEEARKRSEAAVVLTVETQPWQDRRRSGELPLAFLARVERLPLQVPLLRDRPDDIEAQARWLIHALAAELKTEIEPSAEAIAGLRAQSFAESNSRELRNAVERAVYRCYREADVLTWSHLEPFLRHGPRLSVASAAPTPQDTLASSHQPSASPAATPTTTIAKPGETRPAPNEWQRRLRILAAKFLMKGTGRQQEEARILADQLFDEVLPELWNQVETARNQTPPIPMSVWEDVWRCFAVSWLGGPAPAERVLGIPANTLRQWINDRETR